MVGNANSGRKTKYNKESCDKALKRYMKKYKGIPTQTLWIKRKIRPSFYVIFCWYSRWTDFLLYNGVTPKNKLREGYEV